MTFEDLLDYWARWADGREDAAIGYAVSRINRMMAGAVALPESGAGSLLPYGVDGDGIGVLVDNAICALPDKYYKIVLVEYRYPTRQAHRCSLLGITPECYRKRLQRARDLLQADSRIQNALNYFV